jgi:hypothetical protein
MPIRGGCGMGFGKRCNKKVGYLKEKKGAKGKLQKIKAKYE